MHVYEEKVELPTGKIIEDYSLVDFEDVVAVIATDKQDNIIMIEEYKHGGKERVIMFPAGTLEKNEDPKQTAKRELAEETGYTGGTYSLIQTFLLHPSKSGIKAHIYRAKNVELTKKVKHEETEFLKTKILKKDELKKLVMEGKIKIPVVIASACLADLI